MDHITVKPGETRIITDEDTPATMATYDIGADIVLTIYDPAAKKAGMARTTDMDKLKAMIAAIADGLPDTPEAPIQARLVGGDDSEAAREQVLHVIQAIGTVDAGRNIVSIVSADLNAKPHPDAFFMRAGDGTLARVE